MNTDQLRSNLYLVLVWFCFLPSTLLAQPIVQVEQRGLPGEVDYLVAQMQVEARQVTLSGKLLVTFQVEGPKPVRVNLPTNLLSSTSAPSWKIQAKQLPIREVLANHRERWEQVFRLDPYVPGEAVDLSFLPLLVQAGNATTETQITFPAISIRVNTQITDVSLDSLRPITNIELVPEPLTVPQSSSMLPWILLALGIVGLIRWWILRWSRQTRPIDLWQRLQTRLQQLEQEAPTIVHLHEWSMLLRQGIERKFQIPAQKLTTGELLMALQAHVQFDPNQLSSWQEHLTLADQMRFAPESQLSRQHWQQLLHWTNQQLQTLESHPGARKMS